MPIDEREPIHVDSTLVQQLAATNGLTLSAERAVDLVAAVQAILDADAQLAALDLGEVPAVGLPWATWRGER